MGIEQTPAKWMQLLIPEVPADLHDWIERQRAETRMTQQSFHMGLIEDAYRTEQHSLFDDTPQSARPEKGRLRSGLKIVERELPSPIHCHI